MLIASLYYTLFSLSPLKIHHIMTEPPCIQGILEINMFFQKKSKCDKLKKKRFLECHVFQKINDYWKTGMPLLFNFYNALTESSSLVLSILQAYIVLFKNVLCNSRISRYGV